MHDSSDWSKSLRIEVRGDEVASHAGSVIPRMLVDATGLTSALSVAVSRPEVVHDRGAVLRDVAVAIADGTDCIADARVLVDQPRVFGPSRRSRRCGARSTRSTTRRWRGSPWHATRFANACGS